MSNDGVKSKRGAQPRDDIASQGTAVELTHRLIPVLFCRNCKCCTLPASKDGDSTVLDLVFRLQLLLCLLPSLFPPTDASSLGSFGFALSPLAAAGEAPSVPPPLQRREFSLKIREPPPLQAVSGVLSNDCFRAALQKEREETWPFVPAVNPGERGPTGTQRAAC